MTSEVESPAVQKTARFAIAYILPMVTLVVPLLYFVGRVRSDSYWNYFQIPQGIMTYSFEDYVYTGFLAISLGIVSAFSWAPLGPFGAWLIAVILIAVILGIAVALRRWAGTRLKEKIFLFEKKIRNWKADESKWHVQFAIPFLESVQWIGNIFLIVLIPLLFLVGTILWADHSGKANAKRDAEFLRATGEIRAGNARTILHLHGNDELQSGAAIGCSGDWCAMTRRREIVVVPKASIERFDHCPKTLKLSNGVWVCDSDSRITP